MFLHKYKWNSTLPPLCQSKEFLLQTSSAYSEILKYLFYFCQPRVPLPSHLICHLPTLASDSSSCRLTSRDTTRHISPVALCSSLALTTAPRSHPRYSLRWPPRLGQRSELRLRQWHPVPCSTPVWCLVSHIPCHRRLRVQKARLVSCCCCFTGYCRWLFTICVDFCSLPCLDYSTAECQKYNNIKHYLLFATLIILLAFCSIFPCSSVEHSIFNLFSIVISLLYWVHIFS